MAAITWPKPPRGPGSAPWTRADQVLIDEAADLIERTPSIAHIVVDEAQDLSPMEVRAIGRRCATGAATVLGDIAQGTTPWAATSWPTLLSTWVNRPRPSASSTSATACRGRYSTSPPGCCPRSPPTCPGQVTARGPERARGPACQSRRTRRARGGRLRGRTRPPRLGRGDLRRRGHREDRGGAQHGGPGLQRPRLQSGMSGAGAPDIPDISDMSESVSRLTLVPVTLAKGLEFDHVVLVEPANIATGEACGPRRLYVALTRAVSRLTVFHAEPLPAELSLHTIRGAFEVGPWRGRRPARAFRSGGRGLSLERRLRDQHRGGILRRSGRARFWQNYDQ